MSSSRRRFRRRQDPQPKIWQHRKHTDDTSVYGAEQFNSNNPVSTAFEALRRDSKPDKDSLPLY